MFLRIEKGSAVPISRQIAEQIATLCASGTLRPGERLPSVRELARELAVNQNTILRVYERLVRRGAPGDAARAGDVRRRPGQAAANWRSTASGWSTSCGRSPGRPSASASRPTNCTSCWPKRSTACIPRPPSSHCNEESIVMNDTGD